MNQRRHEREREREREREKTKGSGERIWWTDRGGGKCRVERIREQHIANGTTK